VNEQFDTAEEPRNEIAGLETRIEELADGLERCRKLDAVSKIVIAGGALWFLAGLFGLVTFSGMVLAGSITAVLGGIVLNGSNSSTMQQTQAALDAAEARRAELIGSIELRVVQGGVDDALRDPGRTLH